MYVTLVCYKDLRTGGVFINPIRIFKIYKELVGSKNIKVLSKTWCKQGKQEKRWREEYKSKFYKK